MKSIRRLVPIAFAAACAVVSHAATAIGAPSFREETVRFAGAGVTLSGRLFTPGATRAGERRPAIVLMHGCSGPNNTRGQLAARHRDWAERFASSGFDALVVDSFGPRDIASLCELKVRPIDPWRERTADAYAALDYLVSRDDVARDRVFVLGWSHGGSTVMSVARGRIDGGAVFRAAIAFYPGCERPLRTRGYAAAMPLLVLAGGGDDWVPAAPCETLAERTRDAMHPVETVIYPGAHHGFDAPNTPIHFLPNVFNPRAPDERGAHVGTDPAARARSIDAVRAFLTRQSESRTARR